MDILGELGLGADIASTQGVPRAQIPDVLVGEEVASLSVQVEVTCALMTTGAARGWGGTIGVSSATATLPISATTRHRAARTTSRCCDRATRSYTPARQPRVKRSRQAVRPRRRPALPRQGPAKPRRDLHPPRSRRRDGQALTAAASAALGRRPVVIGDPDAGMPTRLMRASLDPAAAGRAGIHTQTGAAMASADPISAPRCEVLHPRSSLTFMKTT
jgi:hypothetical protein